MKLFYSSNMILIFLLSALVAATSADVINPTTPELISRHGYPVKTYHVTTEDGYILTHHRIPHGKKHLVNPIRPVVILSHGVHTSSSLWVLNGPTESLGFILADAGYDVWLTNSRGNIYSTNHSSLATNSSEFWNFSWHEMGVYDLPDTIDFIINKLHCTKVFHIGHSNGATAFYVMASQKPNYCAKVAGHISLGPTVFMSHTTMSLFSFFAELDLLRTTDFITMTFGNFALPIASPSVINFTLLNSQDASNIFYGLMGRGKTQHSKSTLREFFKHFPQGGSIKEIFHLAQLKNSGKFRQYDYRELANQQIYGSLVPTEYDLANVKIPVFVVYGGKDIVATTEGVQSLTPQLPNLKKTKYIASAAHMDYIIGSEAYNNVFPEIQKFFLHLTGV